MSSGTANRTKLVVAACAFGAFGVIVGALVDIVTWFQGTLTANVAADLALAPIGLLITFLGVLITIRRPGNRIGWLFGVVAFFTGLVELSDAYAARALVAAPGTLPGGLAAGWLANWVWVPVAFGLLACLPLIFPNGILLTPRWRWVWRLVIAHIVLLSVALAFAPSNLNDYRVENPLGIETPGRVLSLVEFAGFILILPSVAVAAAAIFLRFRRSQGLERLQVKWLALGALVATSVFAVSLAATYAGSDVIWNFTMPIAIASVVLASGLAVLRYRLYDIDRIISRTLTYGIVSVVLGAAYVGLVLAGQAVFSSSPAARALRSPSRRSSSRRSSCPCDRVYRGSSTAASTGNATTRNVRSSASATASAARSSWRRSPLSSAGPSTRRCSRPTHRCGCGRTVRDDDPYRRSSRVVDRGAHARAPRGERRLRLPRTERPHAGRQ